MDYSTVYIEELQNGIASDSLGNFRLTGLCTGDYHLRFNHIGCETRTLFISLLKDTVIRINMHHHNELMDEVEIHDHHSEHETVTSTSINKEDIQEIAKQRPFWKCLKG